MSKKRIYLVVLGVLVVIAVSAASGGLAGSLVARRMTPTTDRQTFQVPSTTTVSGLKTPVTTATTSLKLVPLQMDDFATRVLPEDIFNRRSPVAVLYAHKKKAGDDILPQEEQIGRAVALTSDGWFASSASVIGDTPLAEVVLWHDGRAYDAERMVLDKATQAVFIKTAAKDLPVTPFADVWANRTGVGVWLELSAEQFLPSSILSLRSSQSSDPRSSERAERRLVVLGSVQKAEKGAPVWDSKGSLVGLIDTSADGRLTVMPGSALSASLQSLISYGQIQHASLGVYSVDRSLVRFSDNTTTLPDRGAWLREDKKSGKAVVPGSVAEKAGLKSGDVILQVDRDIMDGSLDLGDVILQYRPGSNVTLRVWHDGKESDVPVTLGTQATGEPLP